MGGVKFPTLGSQRGPANRRRPDSICRASCGSAAAAATRAAAGFWASITIRSCCRTPKRKPENTQPATRDERYARRLKMLERGGSRFRRSRRGRHRRRSSQADRKSSEMILSPRMEAFDLSKESDKMRDAYGRSAVRRGLPAGAAAGRGGRDVCRSEPGRLGHARRQLQPRGRATTRSSTSRWPSSSPTCSSAACSSGRS